MSSGGILPVAIDLILFNLEKVEGEKITEVFDLKSGEGI